MLTLIVAVLFIFLRGGSTPVTPDVAIKRFREVASRSPSASDTKAAPGAVRSVDPAPEAGGGSVVGVEPRGSVRRSLPPEGVYVYATKGGDSIDALGGSKHTYPSRTTITVQHAGCGVTERWDALKERWDEVELCSASSGYNFERFTTSHEFFRSRDTREFGCSGLAYPSGMSRGKTWTYRCVSGDVTSTTNNRVIGEDEFSIAGARITATRIHLEVQVIGGQQGSSTRDVWISDSGLIVRQISTTDIDTEAPVAGRMHYHEQYEIRLQSLTPRT